MEFLSDLWLPILLSSVFVFVASSIMHMALPFHKRDYKKLPDEADVLDAMRTHGVAPGHYMFPCAGSMKDSCTPEMIEKYEKGPCGFMTVVPTGRPAMGKSLVQWFLYSLLVSVLAAYVARVGRGPGADYLEVFRVTGTAAILGYAVGSLQDSIWKGQSWGITLKFIFDGVLYGLLTAGTFGWLWPGGV
ncbi:MAG: hypothetical protein ACE5EO_07010 [Candidatus Krumholzibacteriia bacterium]